MSTKFESGIKVFGSAILRVEPDVASMEFAVSRVAKLPSEVFQETHQAAKTIREYLTKVSAPDVATSLITLARESEYRDGRNQFVGYKSRISFSVRVTDLDRMEELLVGVVAAGANEIQSVQFQTSKLKDYRADARRRAVAAAREKAENYCRATGVSLGAVISLEDMNPGILRGSGEGHVSQETPSADDMESQRALSPSSIIVGAAVSVVYAIVQ